MVHGLGAVKEEWYRLPELLSQDRLVITFDNRGMGPGARPEELQPFTLADLASDIVALMDLLELHTADIMGLSMGGIIVTKTLLLYPHRFRRAIICCSSAGGRESAVTKEFRQLHSKPPETPAQYMRESQALNLSARFRAAHATLLDELAAFSLGLQRPFETIVLQNACMRKFSHVEDLPKIQQPVLLLHGTDDCVLPHSNSLLFRKHLPNASLVLFREVGHAIFLEEPAQAAAQVIRFLDAPEVSPSSIELQPSAPPPSPVAISSLLTPFASPSVPPSELRSVLRPALRSKL
jgi:pimeloyl-ACP methyl ester carboxylesterase